MPPVNVEVPPPFWVMASVVFKWVTVRPLANVEVALSPTMLVLAVRPIRISLKKWPTSADIPLLKVLVAVPVAVILLMVKRS